MIITCGQCQAKFKVAPEQIKETGSKVRCSNCQYVFTVYRPQRPAAETKVPEKAAASADPLDELLKAMDEKPETSDSSFDDNLERLLKKTSQQQSGGGSLVDDLEDLFEDDDEGRSASPKERRDRRRRLYSDLEDEPGKSTFDDSMEELFEETEPDSEAGEAHPPLRRAKAAAKAAEPQSDETDEEDGFDDDFDDVPPKGEDELPQPLEDRRKDNLGLSANPVDGGPAEAGETVAGPAEKSTVIRAAESPSGKKSQLFLVLAIVAAALAIAVYFMANRPEPMALSTGDQAADQGTAVSPEDAGPVDTAGTEGITFTKTNQNHYFRENVNAGTILIITGMVRNSYPESRRFIHLRGLLLAGDGSTLADRYSYAGNLISEEDLINLPIPEIISRLSIRGGQNGLNMNVEPGKEIPFMLVFDKLPDGMAEYRIDPMGSSPVTE